MTFRKKGKIGNLLKKNYIPREWEQVADQIKQDTKKSVVMCIVIGRIDSGKSTFCKYLTNTWTASGIRVGYIDSDLGQSTIGPPTTVGLKIFNTPPQQRDYSNFFDLHFVGNTAPIYLGNIKVEQGEKECGKTRAVRYL